MVYNGSGRLFRGRKSHGNAAGIYYSACQKSAGTSERRTSIWLEPYCHRYKNQQNCRVETRESQYNFLRLISTLCVIGPTASAPFLNSLTSNSSAAAQRLYWSSAPYWFLSTPACAKNYIWQAKYWYSFSSGFISAYSMHSSMAYIAKWPFSLLMTGGLPHWKSKTGPDHLSFN